MFFLILGIILGIIAVFFVIQNTDVVTVAFASWHLEGSLALILILTLITGIVVTLLLVLPSFITDAFALSAAQKKIKALELELTDTKEALHKAEQHTASPSEILIVKDN